MAGSSKLAQAIAQKSGSGGGSGIYIKPSKRGSLHTDLGIKQNQTIPSSLLAKKLASNPSPAMRKKLQFAINARKFNH